MGSVTNTKDVIHVRSTVVVVGPRPVTSSGTVLSNLEYVRFLDIPTMLTLLTIWSRV